MTERVHFSSIATVNISWLPVRDTDTLALLRPPATGSLTQRKAGRKKVEGKSDGGDVRKWREEEEEWTSEFCEQGRR